MTDHTHKAFDSDLQDLARMVAEMGGLATHREGVVTDSGVAESSDGPVAAGGADGGLSWAVGIEKIATLCPATRQASRTGFPGHNQVF